MVGTVHRDKYLCLHTRIGSAGNEEEQFELLSGLPLNSPVVVHPDGRTWTLGWEEIANLAKAAFDADALAKIAEEARNGTINHSSGDTVQS